MITGVISASPDDAAQLARFRVALALDGTSGGGEVRPGFLDECERWFAREVAADRFRAWIAFADGAAIGTAGYVVRALLPRLSSSRELEARIHNVYVEAAYRNRGIGEALMHDLLADLRARDVSRVTLAPRERARSFYRRLGFEPSADLKLPPR